MSTIRTNAHTPGPFAPLKPSHFIVTLDGRKFAGRAVNAVNNEDQAWRFDTMRQADAVAHGYRRDFDRVEVEPVFIKESGAA